MSLSEEETNYLRLAILVIKLSPRAVLILFDNRFPPANLFNILSSKYMKLKNLRDKNIINAMQWGLLYPPPSSGTPVSSGTFDITLLICLLRNIATPYIIKPSNGFDKLPTDSDTSEGADLARIKHYRNILAHHTNGSLSNEDFNKAWKDVTQAISRLSGNRYHQDCSDLRVASLDGSDKEVYKKVIKTQQELEQLKKDFKEANTNVIHQKKIEIWKDKEKRYAKTAVTDVVMTGIEENHCVLVTGNSGAGKSSVTHHVALQLEDKGYKIIPIKQPSEIMASYNPNVQQLFVCDDICGRYNVNKAYVEDWVGYEEDFKLIYDNSDVKLLLNTRLIVCQDKFFKIMSFLSPFTVNLASSEYKLTLSERNAMLKKYLPEDEEIEISQESLESQECFPLLCELFGENETLRDDPEKFFSHPFEGFGKDLEQLKISNPDKYCSLAILILHEDNLQETILDSDFEVEADVREKIDDVCEACGIPRGTARSKLKEEIESLQHIYVKRVDGIYRCLHDKMFDFLSAKIGSSIGKCLLKYTSCTFITQRIRIGNCECKDDENVIILEDNLEKFFFKRLFDEILKGNIKDVLFHKQMQERAFEESFIRQLEVLSDDEFRNLMTTEKGNNFSSNNLMRNKSKLYLKSILDNVTKDLDEISKFRLAYAYSLLYQEKISTFHWLLARGLHSVFLYVERRLPDYVNEKINENFNLCISLAVLEEQTEILEKIFQTYSHDSSEDDQNDKRYYPLFLFVCFTGNLRLVKFLHDQKQIYPNTTDSGESAVWLASFANQLQVLKFLISEKYNINSWNDKKATPLYIAAQRGHYDIVKFLVENKADVNLCKLNGSSPLFVACQEGHTGIVELLLKAGSDVNNLKKQRSNLSKNSNIKGVSPLFIASKLGHTDIVNLLIKYHADVKLCTENGKPPLLAALQERHQQIALNLIKARASVNCQVDSGLTLMTVVAGDGLLDAVQILFKNGAHINIPQNHNCTYILNSNEIKNLQTSNSNQPSPLTMAAFNNHKEVAAFLLKHGAEVDYLGVEKATALFEASQRGHEDMVEYLLSMNASVNIYTCKGRTPLFVAVQRRFVDIVRLLLNKGADPNICREDGTSALLIATSMGNMQLVKCLLDNKAKPNLANKNGLCPLLSAAEHGKFEILEMLCNLGGDVDCRNTDLQTPLWIVARHGCNVNDNEDYLECVKCLLNHGANVNACDINDESVLFSACCSPNINSAIVEVLLKNNPHTDKCNKDGIGPLFMAVTNGSLDVVLMLLQHNADVNLKTFENKTPLMAAIECNHDSQIDILKTILEYKADVNAFDLKGENALWKAISKGNSDMVDILLGCGANVEIRIHGKSPLEFSQELGYTDIAHSLYERQGILKRILKSFGWLTSVYQKVSDYS